MGAENGLSSVLLYVSVLQLKARHSKQPLHRSKQPLHRNSFLDIPAFAWVTHIADVAAFRKKGNSNTEKLIKPLRKLLPRYLGELPTQARVFRPVRVI